jgi:hypothetical protein
MKNNKTIELVILTLLGAIIIYIVISQFKIIEKYENIEANAENITDQMNKQIKLVTQLGSKDIKSQLNAYVPHFDVINSYKQKSSLYLNNLKSQVGNSIENKKRDLDMLDNTILRLSQYKNDDFFKELKNTDFKSIKSHNNGTSLNVNRLGFNKYQVQANGGCVKVTEENDYNIVPCDTNDKGQHFELAHVFNETEYRNSMNKAFPQLGVISDVKYPFTFVKSKMTENCLKNSHNKLSLEPCREYEGQRWASSKTPNTCKTLF